LKAKTGIHFWCVFSAAVLWGIAGIFVRAIEKTDVSEMQIVFGRALFSSLIIGIIALFKDKNLFKIRLKDLWIFICSGVFSIVLFNFSYYTTMALTSLSVAAVLLYTAPFFVMLLSLFIFKERMTFNKVGALVIAFVGCCLVSGLLDSSHRISGKALVFGLLTGFGYGLYTIFGELAIKRGYHSLTITFYVFAAATLGTLPFINLKETVTTVCRQPTALGVIFLMAVFNTVIPYLLYTTGLLGVEPSVAPIIATVEPVVATLVGCFIFSEYISFWGVLGVVLVLASVIILNLKQRSLRMKAYAKINLGLDISGKREDGYHTIDTVMQSVSIYDTVTVKKAEGITVECGNGEIENEKNIAFKAAKVFFEAAGINGGAQIAIDKSIPYAAGMGGGSADAAAVLLALNQIYNTNFDSDKLCELALKLGADVPFFIKGGTQRSQGIGEILSEIKPLKKCYFLLVKRWEKPSTGEMYSRLDSENPPHPDMESVIAAIERNDIAGMVKVLDNSFIAVNPPLGLEKRLVDMGALGVSLSGSGPTWYAVFEGADKCRAAVKALERDGINAYFAETAECGVEFE